MHRKTVRNSSLFLLELVVAIFFFCLASAVCVRFFVKSHTISQDTHNLDMAVNEAASIAEIFRSEDDVISFLDTHFPDGSIAEDQKGFSLYYNGTWDLSDKNSASYLLSLDMNTKSDFCSAVITVSGLSSNQNIYTLEVGKYMGGGPTP